MNKFQVAFLAIAGVLIASLKTHPVTIEDGDHRYEVNGLDRDEAVFTCRALDANGNTATSGRQTLPIDERYAALVLPRVQWQERGESQKAMAAGSAAP